MRRKLAVAGTQGLRRIIRVLVCIGAGGALAGSSGCPELFREDRDLLTVKVKDHEGDFVEAGAVARGQSTPISMELEPTRPAAPPEYDIAASPDDHAIGAAPLPPGIRPTLVDTSADGTSYTGVLSVDDEAALGPIYFRAYSREAPYDSQPFPAYEYDIVPVNVYTGTSAPYAVRLVPDSGYRGSFVDVEVFAANFEEPVTMTTGDPNVLVISLTYAPEDNRVCARLDISTQARTGETFLVIRSGNGNRSFDLPFIVRHAGRPVFRGIFPNFAHAGDTVEVTVGGNDFTPGTILRSLDPRASVVGLRRVDSHRLTASVRFDRGLTEDVQFEVEAVGGITDPFTVRVVGSGFEAPSIQSVGPSDLVEDTEVQVRFEGVHLDTGGAFEVVAIPSDGTWDGTVEGPFIDTSILPLTADHPGFVIAKLRVDGEADFDGEVLLALRRVSDGILTGARSARIRRNYSSRPFLHRAEVGRIRPGTDVVETLYGRDLHDVVRVIVESGGVESFGEVDVRTGAMSIGLTLRAEADAPLTGDAATNIVLVTRTGARSNAISYTVVAEAAACNEVEPTAGAKLKVTGDPSYVREIVQPEPSAPSMDGLGRPQVSFGLYPLGSLRIVFQDDIANIHMGTGDLQTVLMSFFDFGGSYWTLEPGLPVQVIEDTPTRLVLCIDAQLPATGSQVPSQLRVTGYGVINR